MNRYDHWTEKRLTKLKQTELFQKCLLPDIRTGEVFPALRGRQVHFYCHGRKLFSYSSGGFQTNAAFVVALEKARKGEVKEKELPNLHLVKNFVDGYRQIKKNTKLYQEDESSEVSQLCMQFSFGKKPEKLKGRIVVLDIELSLEALDEDRSQDRIDLVLYHLDKRTVRFFEVKLLRDSRVRATRGQIPEVIAQLNRYNRQVKIKKKELLANYQQYAEKMRTLFDIEMPLPGKIDPCVDLLLFGFTNADSGRVKSVVSVVENNGLFCSSKGSIGKSDISSTMQKKWWPKGRT